MYRISIQKSTGKIIEIQSGGYSEDQEYCQKNLDILFKNAINYGYPDNDLEIKFITDIENADYMSQIEKENKNLSGDNSTLAKLDMIEQRLNDLDVKYNTLINQKIGSEIKNGNLTSS